MRGKKWTYGFGGWKEGNENLINQRFEVGENRELGALDSIDNGVMRNGMQNVSDVVRCGHTNKHNREGRESELVDFTYYGNCHFLRE